VVESKHVRHQLEPERIALLSHFSELSASVPTLKSLQQGIVDAIAQRLPYYSWTGFYMLDPSDPEMLILGPFVGDSDAACAYPGDRGDLQRRCGFGKDCCRR